MPSYFDGDAAARPGGRCVIQAPVVRSNAARRLLLTPKMLSSMNCHHDTSPISAKEVDPDVGVRERVACSLPLTHWPVAGSLCSGHERVVPPYTRGSGRRPRLVLGLALVTRLRPSNENASHLGCCS
jgi:hypothetical protein